MKRALLFACLFISMPALAAEKSWIDQQTSQAKQSNITTTSKTATTQKTYQIAPTDNAVTKKAVTTQYAHHPGYGVYEDTDLDGQFGESEAALVDTDGDGRKGESEATLGTESVNQNQKITVLNNMGMGSSLSSFSASGQVNRESIYKEKDKKTKKEKPAEEAENPPVPISKRVLVS